MVETPIILPNIRPFDASKNYNMVFHLKSDNQTLENQLIIEDNLGREVYNNSVNMAVHSHIIPAYVLENGNDYKAKVRVRVAGLGWSDFSNYELFSCLTPAKVTITNIDYSNNNQIYNQNFTFKAEFEQKENDLPSMYRFKLYDENDKLIRNYDEKVFNGSIEQHMEDLEDRIRYSVEVVVESRKNSITTSGKIPFIPSYEVTSLSAVLEPKNVPDKGAIQVRSRLTQITGKVYDNNDNLIDEDDVEFVDDEFLDLNRYDYDRLVFDEGLLYSDNSYTVKIWLYNIKESTPHGRELFKSIGSGGESNLYFYNNRFHLFKKGNKDRIINHYASNVVEQSNGYMVQFSSNMGFVDILAKEV